MGGKKKSHYDEYDVSSHFDQARRIVYSRPEWSFDEKQHLYIYFNNTVLYENFMYLFSGRVAQLHPRYYFNQLNYIKGTYIRKDKFAQMIEKKHKEVVIDLEFIPVIPTEDFIKEWKRYMSQAGIMLINSTGIPKKYTKDEISN